MRPLYWGVYSLTHTKTGNPTHDLTNILDMPLKNLDCFKIFACQLIHCFYTLVKMLLLCSYLYISNPLFYYLNNFFTFLRTYDISAESYLYSFPVITLYCTAYLKLFINWWWVSNVNRILSIVKWLWFEWIYFMYKLGFLICFLYIFGVNLL